VTVRDASDTEKASTALYDPSKESRLTVCGLLYLHRASLIHYVATGSEPRVVQARSGYDGGLACRD
jgi:hypothetical protein